MIAEPPLGVRRVRIRKIQHDRVWSMMAAPMVEPGTSRRPETESLSPYHVVLLDDAHSVYYAIRMLEEMFGHSPEKEAKMAKEVHASTVATTNLEEAELKQEQIQSYGLGPLVPRCEGSMSAEGERASG